MSSLSALRSGSQVIHPFSGAAGFVMSNDPPVTAESARSYVHSPSLTGYVGASATIWSPTGVGCSALGFWRRAAASRREHVGVVVQELRGAVPAEVVGGLEDVARAPESDDELLPVLAQLGVAVRRRFPEYFPLGGEVHGGRPFCRARVDTAPQRFVEPHTRPGLV